MHADQMLFDRLTTAATRRNTPPSEYQRHIAVCNGLIREAQEIKNHYPNDQWVIDKIDNLISGWLEDISHLNQMEAERTGE